MGDTSEAVEINMTSSVELCSSLLQQLGEALTELESQNVIPSMKVPWKDIESHFRNLETTMKKKIEELEAKEKELKERESHNHTLIVERETQVVEKEQDMLDKLQELKDAAMAAITEAKQNCVPESLESPNGNKVSSAPEVAVPLSELTQFCEQMDSIGLVKFLSGNLNHISSNWKEELSGVLGRATEPARFVLNALEGFFPTQEEENTESALSGMRKSCIIVMEAMSKAELVTEWLNPGIQEEAKCIANQWKLKFSEDSVNAAANDKSLEAEGFLRLLSTFMIASHFDEEELCKYVLAVAHHRQATELARSLHLTQKIPGLVETLIRGVRHIDAVHFIQAFGLSEAFPPVPLLKTYLKDLRRNLQGNGSASLLNKNNKQELKAVRDVIECIEEYKLEDYPLEPLYKRVAQLDRNFRGSDRKRIFEPSKTQDQQKKSRSDGRPRGHRGRGGGDGRRGPPPHRTSYGGGGVQERYVPTVPNPYSYPVSSVQQPSYAAQASDQSLGYYSQDIIRPPGVYALTAPSYASSLAAPSYGSTTGVPSYGSTTGVPSYGSTGVPSYGSTAAVPGYGSTAAVPGYGSTTAVPGYGSTTAIPGYGSYLQSSHQPQT